MTERDFFSLLLVIVFAAAPLTAIALLYITAPYGRHVTHGWGPKLNAKLSWFLMESAALVAFDITYFYGTWIWNPISLIFFVLWQVHYLDRTILFHLRLPKTTKQTPIFLMLLGAFFNTANGYLNARYLTFFGPEYSISWLTDPRFILGMILFVVGFGMNRYADSQLFKLRKPGETDYKIPKGLLFDYVSCPNYLGEIIEWFGWAIATWSLPGLAFALFTAANLIPRAYAHHQWYQESFPHYPRKRKAIIPLIL